jgi:hypothetical protein
MNKPYRSSHDSNYMPQIFVLLALNLLTATAGGLGILYMRQEISASADRIRATQVAISDTERRLQYVNVQIAEATAPEILKRRIAELSLNLVPPDREQVVRMPALPERKVKATGVAPSEPILVTFELALLKGGYTKIK